MAGRQVLGWVAGALVAGAAVVGLLLLAPAPDGLGDDAADPTAGAVADPVPDPAAQGVVPSVAVEGAEADGQVAAAIDQSVGDATDTALAAAEVEAGGQAAEAAGGPAAAGDSTPTAPAGEGAGAAEASAPSAAEAETAGSALATEGAEADGQVTDVADPSATEAGVTETALAAEDEMPVPRDPAAGAEGATDPAADPILPELREFRLDPDGLAIVAGVAAPAVTLQVLVDGAPLAEVETAADGQFVAYLTIPPAGQPRQLSLLADPAGAAIASDQVLLIAPAAEAVAATDGPAETLTLAQSTPVAGADGDDRLVADETDGTGEAVAVPGTEASGPADADLSDGTEPAAIGETADAAVPGTQADGPSGTEIAGAAGPEAEETAGPDPAAPGSEAGDAPAAQLSESTETVMAAGADEAADAAAPGAVGADSSDPLESDPPEDTVATGAGPATDAADPATDAPPAPGAPAPAPAAADAPVPATPPGSLSATPVTGAAPGADPAPPTPGAVAGAAPAPQAAPGLPAVEAAPGAAAGPSGLSENAPPDGPPPVVAADSPALAPPADSPAQAPVLLSDDEGVRLLQPAIAAGAAPEVLQSVALDSIAYDAAGEVILAGRASGGGLVRLYLDNAPVAVAPVRDGIWDSVLPDVSPGVYTLRADQIAADGAVISRIEMPFQRSDRAAVAAALDVDEGLGVTVKTVQPGHTLWAIARERYGEGVLYVEVFEANRDRIRDPDLIFPGQIFVLPEIEAEGAAP